MTHRRSAITAALLGLAVTLSAPGAQAAQAGGSHEGRLTSLAAAVAGTSEYSAYRRGRRVYRGRRGNAGAAIAAGAAAAVIGGAIAASARPRYYDQPYGGYGYYGRPSGYNCGYYGC